ncbi:MAG TPA: hypothetical protein VLB68_05945 [Pyrinomonadaceae bacterium]|nr:hypothetical protein [Pyrinomonadaceae bacterium]
MACSLIVFFKAEEQAMLPLYALGVFLSFTLSQAGMVVHWQRLRKADEAQRQIKLEEEIHRTQAEDMGVVSHEAERLQALERDRGGSWRAYMINATRKLKEKWLTWGEGVQLVVLQSPYRSLTRPLLKYIERASRQSDNLMVTVLLPEFVPAKWWHQLLHNQSSLLLKGALLFRKGVIVTSVPYHLEK